MSRPAQGANIYRLRSWFLLFALLPSFLAPKLAAQGRLEDTSEHSSSFRGTLATLFI